MQFASSEAELVKPKFVQSWQALIDNAKLHQFLPILGTSTTEYISDVHYRRHLKFKIHTLKTIQQLVSQSLKASHKSPRSSGKKYTSWITTTN